MIIHSINWLETYNIVFLVFYFIKPGLGSNYTIIWIIMDQELNLEEVKLQRKLYLKLIESPVKPSSYLGASSRKLVKTVYPHISRAWAAPICQFCAYFTKYIYLIKINMFRYVTIYIYHKAKINFPGDLTNLGL